MINILLAEDSSFCVRNLTRTLENFPIPHEVTVVSDGQAAIDILGLGETDLPTIRPDLLLLDLQMPCMSGLEVLTVIRENAETADLPVIILTTSDSPFDMDLAGTLVADDYLVKDCSPSTICRSIERVFRRSPPKMSLGAIND